MVAIGNYSMAYHFVITCSFFGQQFVKVMTGFNPAGGSSKELLPATTEWGLYNTKP